MLRVIFCNINLPRLGVSCSVLRLKRIMVSVAVMAHLCSNGVLPAVPEYTRTHSNVAIYSSTAADIDNNNDITLCT